MTIAPGSTVYSQGIMRDTSDHIDITVIGRSDEVQFNLPASTNVEAVFRVAQERGVACENDTGLKDAGGAWLNWDMTLTQSAVKDGDRLFVFRNPVAATTQGEDTPCPS